MYRKVHILGVQVHNVQLGATRTRRQGKDWRCARLCSGNERQRELICLSNAHAHANFPRWFHWTTIQVVQCDTSQRMPGHRHMRDPSPLSAICVVGAHSGGEVCVETGGVLHSPMQGTPMRLDVHGGGVVDAKAYKGWPGVVFNSKAHHGPAPCVPAAHWWLSGNGKLGLIWGSVVHCDVFVLVCCAFCMLGNVHLMFLEVLDTHLVKVQGGGYFFWRRLS